MKRLILLFSLALTFACAASAQDVWAGVGGGVASHYGGTTRNVGHLRLGVSYEAHLSDLLSLEPGLYYSVKGWKNRDRVVTVFDDEGRPLLDNNGQEVTGKMNVTAGSNYVELPLLLNFKVYRTDDGVLALTVGPYAAIGVGGKTKTRGDTEQTGASRYYFSYPTFDATGAHRFDAGIAAGVSWQFAEAFRAGIMADFGLTSVSRQGGRNMAVAVTLAYKF